MKIVLTLVFQVTILNVMVGTRIKTVDLMYYNSKEKYFQASVFQNWISIQVDAVFKLGMSELIDISLERSVPVNI